MDWKRLKNSKCPKCNAPIKADRKVFKCTKCDFLISGSKFNEIIKRLYHQSESHHFRDIGEEENLSRLNDL